MVRLSLNKYNALGRLGIVLRRFRPFADVHQKSLASVAAVAYTTRGLREVVRLAIGTRVDVAFEYPHGRLGEKSCLHSVQLPALHAPDLARPTMQNA